ncbi:MAG TPA: tetratricopeptide repeat protein [Pyrinomonadaceae bacterium]
MVKPGTVLQDQYRVVRQLGQGGMGAVYEAIDEELSCLVAIKETLVETDELKRKFRKEASLLANLDHPVLPKVRRHFVESNSQFLVMDYIEGDDLAVLLEKRDGNPFQVAKVLVWADQLLDALEELHLRRPPIIHHDIKPSNLKLKSKDRIILLDFGLARGAAGQMLQTISEYRSKNIHGFTRGYAPKEQILKQGTDARADLYSLAATLWTLLTGEVPPDALQRMGETDDGNPDPLRPVNKINPQVSSAAAAVLQKALSLNRDQRYADATEMRRALREARIEEFYQAAHSAMKDEEWGTAIEHLEIIRGLDPSRSDAALLLHQAQQKQQLSTMYADGREHLEAGRMREALELFQQIDGIQGGYQDASTLIEKIQRTIAAQEAEALYESALQEMAQEKWALAIEQLQKALDLIPSHAQAKLKLDHARQQRDLMLLYHAALKHYKEGRWREALNDLRRIKEIDENYRDTVNLIENCQRKIEEQQVDSHTGEAQQLQAVASQSTVDKNSSEIDLATAEVPAALNVISSKEDSSQEVEDSSQQKKGKSRSKLILSVATLVVGAIVIAVAVSMISNRRAEAAKAAEQQYKVGTNFLNDQKYAEAEAALREAIRLNPNYAYAHFNLGNALDKQQKYAEAEVEFREAIQLNPNDAYAYSNLGETLNDQQKHAEAEAEIRKAIKLKPNMADFRYNLGLTLHAQEKYGEAEAEFIEAIRLEPSYFEAYTDFGNTLYAQKKYAEAEAQYRAAIRIEPKYAPAHYNLGNTLHFQKNYAGAEVEYKAAIQLGLNFAPLHYNLGLILNGRRKYAEAEVEFRKAIQLDPNHASAHNDLGNALSDLKKYPEAEAEYRAAIQIDPNNPWFHDNLGLALYARKRYAEAEVEFRKATELEPNYAPLHYNLGLTLYVQKKYAEAEVAAEEAVRLDPSNANHTQLVKMIKARR